MHQLYAKYLMNTIFSCFHDMNIYILGSLYTVMDIKNATFSVEVSEPFLFAKPNI